MGLDTKITENIKEAMKAKDRERLDALRAIKNAIILARTEAGASEELSEAEELKLLQKMQKQRMDSLAIFEEQGRDDLAHDERAQLEVIQEFLPEPLSEDELRNLIQEIIAQTGAESMKDMGKVMGMANARVAGRADGKTISGMVKTLLG
jgi:uncharacterized protein YqeY